MARNPVTLIVPLILLLAFMWRYYAYLGRAYSLPATYTGGISLSQPLGSSDGGVPAGWDLGHTGDLRTATRWGAGHSTGKSFTVTVSDYRSGDALLTAPARQVRDKGLHLFKGYYRSDVPFELLARFTYGEVQGPLQHVADYPATGTDWTAVSHAFDPNDSISSVTYSFRLAGNGSLSLNGLYCEPREHVYVAPELAFGENLIPNSELNASTDLAMPSQWQPYQTGEMRTSFTYHQASPAYLSGRVEDYRDGEAKWQHTPQDVMPYERYQYQVLYRSDTNVEVVAEYQTESGRHEYVVLGELGPAGDWTKRAFMFENPEHVRSVFVSVVLHGNGTLDMRDPSLRRQQSQGELRWVRPLVSVTFDDGWQSEYTLAAPVLQRLQMPATMYVNPMSIETPHFMQAWQLGDLRQKGFEIASHGYQHQDMSALSTGRLEYLLREGRDYLQKAGYPGTNFSAPFGRIDPEVAWHVRQIYATARGTESGLNTKQNFDPYNLRVAYISNDTSIESFTHLLDQARQYNGWLVVVYHQIGYDAVPSEPFSVGTDKTGTDKFEQAMDAVRDSGIRVVTVQDAYAELSK